jgi:tetratricopeptide (TPR) repeat protein
MAGAPYKIGVVALAVLSMLRFMWYANILPAEAGYWASLAAKIHYVSQGREFHKAFAALQHALALNTYLNVDLRMGPIRLGFSEFAAAPGQTVKIKAGKQFSRQTLEYLAGQFYHNLHDHHPDIKDYLSHIIYGRIAQSLAAYDPAWMEKALESYRQSVQEYPHRWQLIAAFACAYFEMGRVEDALKVYEAHPLEVAEGVFFFNYAAALYAVGRSEDAWEQIERALEARYDFTRSLPKLVAVLTQEKRYGRIARLYEFQLQSYQKDNPQLMASLVQTYKDMGDDQNVQRAAAKLLAVAPHAQQDIHAFLKSLVATSTTATAIVPQCQ